MFDKLRIKLIILFLTIAFLTTTAFGCKGSVSKEEAVKVQPITLNYWRVWDSGDAFDDIIAAYRVLHPNITIRYRKLRYDEYERELLDAFAEGRGPDIFSIHAGWSRRYQNKIKPLPEKITMAYPIIKGTIKKEETIELVTKDSLSLEQVRDNFVPAVYDPAVIGDQIYGLPLSVDTMVLFYNRDLLNNAGITEVPRYWNDDFLQDVKKLTKKNEQGDITQAGVSLGSSTNIERYSDILSLLIMQNGAEMLDSQGRVSFQKNVNKSSSDYAPGMEALRFYTDFANPIKEVYTWNADMPNSLQSFIDGSSAFFFGYAYHIDEIKARAPRLNFGISNMLQIQDSKNSVNFANFWLETVSAQSAHTDEAWDFIQFAIDAANVKSYLDKTNNPTALKSLINEQLEKRDIKVFADQLLTAKIWYIGKDYNAAEVIIGDMIDQALFSDSKQLPRIMQNAAGKIQQTISD